MCQQYNTKKVIRFLGMFKKELKKSLDKKWNFIKKQEETVEKVNTKIIDFICHSCIIMVCRCGGIGRRTRLRI